MKSLIISTTLILFTFCLYGQINYSVGMGPQYNLGIIEPAQQFENANNFSYFGKGELYYTKNKMTFHLAAQWNRTKFIQNFISPGSGRIDEFQFRTDYLNLSPSVGFKPIKFVGINAGGYFGFNIADATFENITETWINASTFNVTSQIDYGLLFGINGYIAQNISLELKYNFGFKNLKDGSAVQFTDNDGNLITNYSIKNRTIQLSFNFHFNDF